MIHILFFGLVNKVTALMDGVQSTQLQNKHGTRMCSAAKSVVAALQERNPEQEIPCAGALNFDKEWPMTTTEALRIRQRMAKGGHPDPVFGHGRPPQGGGGRRWPRRIAEFSVW